MGLDEDCNNKSEGSEIGTYRRTAGCWLRPSSTEEAVSAGLGEAVDPGFLPHCLTPFLSRKEPHIKLAISFIVPLSHFLLGTIVLVVCLGTILKRFIWDKELVPICVGY